MQLRTYQFIAIIIFCLSSDYVIGASIALKSKQDLIALDTALNLFKLDHGRFPTNKEGLKVLANPKLLQNRTKDSPSYKYQEKELLDPWGREYIYRMPGKNNPDSFDILSYGADNLPGGEGENADYGNWKGGFDEIDKQLDKERINRKIIKDSM